MFYRIAAVAIILAMTAAALASLPYGEKKLTADGNVTVLGSSEVEVLADGEARVSIRNTAGTRYPAAAAGDTAYTLQDGVPRTFGGTGLHYVYVDLVTATTVVVTWK
jgi:hypothetical protein